MQKAKWLSEEALQITEKREVKVNGEKERHSHLNAEFQSSKESHPLPARGGGMERSRRHSLGWGPARRP